MHLLIVKVGDPSSRHRFLYVLILNRDGEDFRIFTLKTKFCNSLVRDKWELV